MSSSSSATCSPVSGSTTVMRSISSPNSSMRTAVSSYAGWTSMVSPRTRNLPRHEVHVVALVLHVDELAQDRALVVRLARLAATRSLLAVLLGRAQAVDARHRRDHDDVAPGEQRRRGRVAQPVDLVVDRAVLLDVGVARRDVRLGLVVVVVADEVLDPVLRGRTRGTRWPAGRPATCWGRCTSVGRCTCSIVQAMVALLPEPVMPSSVWNRSPRSMPSASCAMAFGWSPAGAKSETTLNGGTDRCYRGGVTLPPGGESAAGGRARIWSHTSATRGAARRVPRVVDHDVRFASRSSRDACTATRARASGSDMPRCSTRRSTATSGRHVDHDDRGEPATSGLDQQRDVEHDDVVGVVLGRDPASRLGADRGMDDRVECLQRLRVVEDDRGEPRTVEAAVAVEDRRAEPLDDGREHRLPGSCSSRVIASASITTAPWAASRRRDGRLAGADASGEADQDHRACATTSPRPTRSTPSRAPEIVRPRENRTESHAGTSRPFTLRRRRGVAAQRRWSTIERPRGREVKMALRARSDRSDPSAPEPPAERRRRQDAEREGRPGPRRRRRGHDLGVDPIAKPRGAPSNAAACPTSGSRPSRLRSSRSDGAASAVGFALASADVADGDVRVLASAASSSPTRSSAPSGRSATRTDPAPCGVCSPSWRSASSWSARRATGSRPSSSR